MLMHSLKSSTAEQRRELVLDFREFVNIFGVPSEKQVSEHWLCNSQSGSSLTVQRVWAGPAVTTSAIAVVA